MHEVRIELGSLEELFGVPEFDPLAGRKEDLDAIKTMREKHHLTVNELPAGAQQEWQTEIAKLYPKLRGDIVPADLFDEVEKALKEFRATTPPAK